MGGGGKHPTNTTPKNKSQKKKPNPPTPKESESPLLKVTPFIVSEKKSSNPRRICRTSRVTVATGIHVDFPLGW